MVYADKEKMFKKVMAMKVPMFKWEEVIGKLCKNEENNWAYNEVNTMHTVHGKRKFRPNGKI